MVITIISILLSLIATLSIVAYFVKTQFPKPREAEIQEILKVAVVAAATLFCILIGIIMYLIINGFLNFLF